MPGILFIGLFWREHTLKKMLIYHFIFDVSQTSPCYLEQVEVFSLAEHRVSNILIESLTLPDFVLILFKDSVKGNA